MAEENEEHPERKPWDGVVRRSIDINVRGVNKDDRSVDVVASTTTIDAHGDILEQDWRLERYLRNPVVLWNHNRFESSPWSMGEGIRPEDLLPIGRCSAVRIEGGTELHARMHFGSAEYNPMSERVFLGFDEGILRGVSVGFRPGRITEREIDGKMHFVLGNNELMELSAVPIGSNPDAVAKSIAFERKHFALRLAAARLTTPAPAAAEPKRLKMAQENDKTGALEKAVEEASKLRSRVVELEAELKAEQSTLKAVREDLVETTERAEKAEAKVAEAAIKALVGKKLYPTEVDDQLALVKAQGLEKALERINKRPDITITSRVQVGDDEGVLRGLDENKNAPAPVGDGEAGAGSAALLESIEA